jgi:hypothetical protein
LNKVVDKKSDIVNVRKVSKNEYFCFFKKNTIQRISLTITFYRLLLKEVNKSVKLYAYKQSFYICNYICNKSYKVYSISINNKFTD